jgi:hypothetical protein
MPVLCSSGAAGSAAVAAEGPGLPRSRPRERHSRRFEALVGGEAGQGRLIDALGGEVDRNAEHAEGLVDGRELATVGGELLARVLGAVSVAAFEGETLARQLCERAMGLDVVEDEEAAGARVTAGRTRRSGGA